MNQPKGHGLIIEAPSPTDYVAGDGKLSGEVINPLGIWQPSTFEHQAPNFETNACASEGTTTALEILYTYIFGTEPNLSARMLAKGSGTDPARGNTPQKVAEWFRKNWSVLEEDWSTAAAKDIKDYYRELPDLLYSKAAVVKDSNVFGYEAITNPTKEKLKDALTKGVVCMSVSLMEDNGIYFKPAGWRDNHWTVLLEIRENGNYKIQDTYEPFIKEIRADFIPEVAYRYTLNEEAVDFVTRAIAWIKSWIAKQPKPVAKPRSRIQDWALAIQHAEGGKPQDRNIRDHNPGNLKFSPYTQSLGAIKHDQAPDGGWYARFPTYDLGFKALCTFLKEACEGKLRSYKPSMSIDDFTKVYANVPSGHGYIKIVAQRLGVTLDTKISTLL
jgi:hypothetical protein